MGLIKLALLNFKFMIKDKKVILLMFVMPFAVSSFICFIVQKETSSSSFPVSIVIKDSGIQGKSLVDEIIESERNFYKITVISEEEAKSKIKDGKALAAYIIPEDFSEKLQYGQKPEVRLLKSGNENVAFKIGQYIDAYVNKQVMITNLRQSINSVNEGLVMENVIATEVNSVGSAFDFARLVLLLLINFIVFSATYVSTEMLSQRKQQTLTRQLTTPHKPWEISGGLILGFALIEIVIYFIQVILLKEIFKLNFGVPLANILIGVLVMVVVSVSIGLFAVRITSNEGLLSIIVISIGNGMGFVSGSFSAPGSLPKAVENLSKFTPQHWFIEIMNGGKVATNSLIILLFALVFFTAGSLKFTRFAKE
jgi:ABC-2 type transport system permease protein